MLQQLKDTIQRIREKESEYNLYYARRGMFDNCNAWRTAMKLKTLYSQLSDLMGEYKGDKRLI